MNEGTKLENKEVDLELQTNEKVSTKDMQGTKIGEVSDFEKSLYFEEAKPPVETNKPKEEVVPEPVATKPEETTPVETAPVETKSQDTPIEQAPTTKETPVTEPEKNEAEAILDFAQQLDNMVTNYERGDIIKGIIRSVSKNGVLVDFKYKSEGFISNAELGLSAEEEVKEGDEIDAYISKLETKEGYALLSKRRADYELLWTKLSDLAKTKDAIEVEVASNVEGGLVAEYKKSIKGFIPASHVVRRNNEDLGTFVGKKLAVTVLQADRQRKKVFFSNKFATRRLNKTELSALLEKLEVGEIREGKVSSIKDFGVFVDLGGVEGLVHISELSWARVSHPTELVKVGDKVKVFILGVDIENRRISLGMKQLKPDPWVTVAQKYEQGQIVEGTINRIVPFGAFIQIDEDLEGLIHISELSNKHIEKAEDAVTVGQKLKAKIIKLYPDEQKIGLSIKALEEEPATEADAPVSEQ